MIWCLAFFFLIDLNYVDLFQLHTLKYSLDMWPKISLRGGADLSQKLIVHFS